MDNIKSTYSNELINDKDLNLDYEGTPRSMIKLAVTDEEIKACFDVMIQLRHHLKKKSFVSEIRNLMVEGYKLAFLKNKNSVLAIAGFRISRNLSLGKYLYIDDLVTSEDVRSQGAGKQMLDWIALFAKRNECSFIHLNSDVQQNKAHRFYLNQRMNIVSYHFVSNLLIA